MDKDVKDFLFKNWIIAVFPLIDLLTTYAGLQYPQYIQETNHFSYFFFSNFGIFGYIIVWIYTTFILLLLMFIVLQVALFIYNRRPLDYTFLTKREALFYANGLFLGMLIWQYIIVYINNINLVLSIIH